MKTVCILTAGLGSRLLPFTSYINKSLLPVDKKAAISHIIEVFPPDTEFVVAIGYLGVQVKDYLTLAHPDINIDYISIHNYSGAGSGVGHSLLQCKELLQKPFYFVSCDTLFDKNDVFFEAVDNWVGVSEIQGNHTENYCNFKIESDRVIQIKDKQPVFDAHYKQFVGLCFIKDYHVFWNGLTTADSIIGGIRALIDNNISVKALDIPSWQDLGSLDHYKKAVTKYDDYDFSKINEFLYIVNDHVIKFFADKTISCKRVTKSRLNPSVFPPDIKYLNGHFYSYPFIQGNILYETATVEIFKEFLSWLKADLWKPYQVRPDEMQLICNEFYYQKTLDRISLYRDKYHDSDHPTTINGILIPSTSELLNKISWDVLISGIPVFFHGDLHFDNSILTNTHKIKLLDWRQDFGGHIEFGDLYYDLAKLYGGLVLNYDYIKKNLISYSEIGNRIDFDFARRNSSLTYIKILTDFIISNGWSIEKVKTLVPLIYLNMAPLHNYPFDKLLYSLGRSMLYEVINDYK